MHLASRNLAVGDTRLYFISYKEWLAKGAVLASLAVTLPAGLTSTVGTITLSPSKEEAWFFINGGVLNEAFTAAVVATDSTGQKVNDTMQFLVMAP